MGGLATPGRFASGAASGNRADKPAWLGRAAAPSPPAPSRRLFEKNHRRQRPEGCGRWAGVRVTIRCERHEPKRRKNHEVSMDRTGTVRLRGAKKGNREETMFLTTSALKARFETNLARSSRVEIATAWATEGPALDLLCKAADVRGVEVRAIVGTYGNATHPEALERLCKIGTLRLAKDNGPMFHPKIYIFHGSAESCAWIGSANFTGAGFARNEEVVHETDDVAGAVEWFARRWRACGRLAPDAIDKYRERRRSQGVLRGLTGVVGRANQGTKKRLALLRGADGWKGYVAALEACNESWLDEGYGWSVLGETHSYVHTIAEAGSVARSERWIGLLPQRAAMLLGLRDDREGAWGLLGSLGAAGTAKQVFLQSQEPDHQRVLRQLRRSVQR